jgi:hypothetical protein
MGGNKCNCSVVLNGEMYVLKWSKQIFVGLKENAQKNIKAF